MRKVIQLDRNACADLHQRYGRPLAAADAISGRSDASTYVQAFVAHREAVLAVDPETMALATTAIMELFEGAVASGGSGSFIHLKTTPEAIARAVFAVLAQRGHDK